MTTRSRTSAAGYTRESSRQRGHRMTPARIRDATKAMAKMIEDEERERAKALEVKRG